MKFLKQIFFAGIILSCFSVHSSQFDDVYAEIDKLKKEIDSLQNSTSKLQRESVDQNHSFSTQKSFAACYNDIVARFGGKATEENFLGRNLTFLNSAVTNDSSMFVRATIDYFMDMVYGDCKQPKIMLHSTFRFRYNWGSNTEVSVSDSSTTLSDTVLSVKGTPVNKHLMWMQEAWLKIALGDTTKPYDHYMQIGLLPFQVGRGISLGAAYQQGGFLGFTPGFSIDQYAPGILFHVNPVPKQLSLEAYIALLENKHTSFKSNNESIRKNELDACPQRGTSRHSYAVALRGLWDVFSEKGKSLNVEPYIVYVQSPDQKLEFANDLDSMLTTYGVAVEGKYKKFTWGFETAVNQGELLIKPWDRNEFKVARDKTTGNLVEKYTKVFSEDPNGIKFNDPSKTPGLAAVTEDNQTVLKASNKATNQNGKEIGTNLYNAFDRFRPKQTAQLKGFFAVADFDYQIIDNVLKVACGVGYSSGDLSEPVNVNSLDSGQLLNREFFGFAPFQSVYAGKRLRHLIIFNRAIPRFSQRNPNGNFSKQNITPALMREKAEFSNIAFLGTDFQWQPQSFKKQKLKFEPNLIFYWIPETPVTFEEKEERVAVEGTLLAPTKFKDITVKEPGRDARNFMGTELTAEVSAYVIDKLKIYGYMGVLFPGAYYKDMCGTLIDKQQTGHNVAFLANIGMNYAF